MSKKLFSLLILVVLVLTLLPATAIAAPPSQGGTSYTLQADDWLSKLADKQYGDVLAFSAIVYYNNLKAAEDDSFSHISDPNLVEAGWTIYLPRRSVIVKMMLDTHCSRWIAKSSEYWP